MGEWTGMRACLTRTGHISERRLKNQEPGDSDGDDSRDLCVMSVGRIYFCPRSEAGFNSLCAIITIRIHKVAIFLCDFYSDSYISVVTSALGSLDVTLGPFVLRSHNFRVSAWSALDLRVYGFFSFLFSSDFTG